MSQPEQIRDSGSARSRTASGSAGGGVSGDLSRKLTAVSFFSACCIVLLHANMHDDAVSSASNAVMYFLSVAMTAFAVPMFFAISGFLIAKKTDTGRTDGWYPATLKKRARTLLIPFFAWCALFAVVFIPVKLLGNHILGKPLLENSFLVEPLLSFQNVSKYFGLNPGEYPALRVLWYLRNLFFLCLLTPLLFPVMRRRRTGLLFLAAVGLVYLLLPALYPLFYGPGFNLQGTLFFPAGIYLANYPLKQDSFRGIRRSLPFLWAGLAALTTWIFMFSGQPHEVSMCFLSACVIAGVGAVWCLYDMVPAFRRLSGLRVSKDSFFLYAFHLLVTDIVTGSWMQSVLMHRLHVPALGVYLLRFLVSLSLSLLAAELLKRFLPRVYGFLTGGR